MKKKTFVKKQLQKKSFKIFSIGQSDRPANQKDADDFKENLDTGRSVVCGMQVGVTHIDNKYNIQYIYTLYNYGQVVKPDQISDFLKLVKNSEITGQDIVVPYCVYVNSIYRG